MKKLVLCVSMLSIVMLMAGAAFAAPFSSAEGGFSIELPAGFEPMPKEQMEPGTYLMAANQKAVMEGKNLSVTGMKVAIPETAQSVSISDFAEAQAQQVKVIPYVKGDVKSEVKNFGGLEWAKTAYEMDAGGMMTIFMARYTAFSGDSIFSFTFTGSDMKSDESVFDKSMETFKLQ